MTMTGCDPQLNLAGAYIPAWLVSLLGGLFAFWLCHLVFLRLDFLPYLKPLLLVYIALINLFTCLIWFFFFAAR